MYYLVDTNVFLHSIRDKIFIIADLCEKNETEITITKTILNELEPGYYLDMEDETAKSVYNCVYNLTYGTMGMKTIRMVSLDDIPGAKEELKKIRKKFYSWMNNADYLKLLIKKGDITADDIKKQSFRNKDLGECELIAIAKTAEDTYQIVTNDKGKVFLHPDQNLFDDYASVIGLIILSSEEWLHRIGCEVE